MKCIITVLVVVCSLLLPPLSVVHAETFADSAFRRVWATADAPVASGRANISWLWGPAPFTTGMQEPYVQSPGNTRLVQYFDKARMEINNPSSDPNSIFYVTNGLLPIELMTGRLQVGDTQFEQREPAQIPVVGDPNTAFPTYADLATVYARQGAGGQIGAPVTRFLHPDGTTSEYSEFRNDPAAVVTRVEQRHGIPQAFDLFQQSTAESYGGLGNLFVYGMPVTDAYWVNATVGGVEQPVMFQVFERRVLTYTPANPRAFQVESGNVGRHYYQWRYGLAPRD